VHCNVSWQTVRSISLIASALLIRFKDVVSAPLWNSEKSAFAGMLTVLDIIHLIQYYYKTAVDYDNAKTDVDKFRLESLRGILIPLIN
jgi:hypothetical protein